MTSEYDMVGGASASGLGKRKKHLAFLDAQGNLLFAGKLKRKKKVRRRLQEEIMRLMFCRKGLRQSIGLLIFNRRGWKKEIVVLQEKIGGPQ